MEGIAFRQTWKDARKAFTGEVIIVGKMHQKQRLVRLVLHEICIWLWSTGFVVLNLYTSCLHEAVFMSIV